MPSWTDLVTLDQYLLYRMDQMEYADRVWEGHEPFIDWQSWLIYEAEWIKAGKDRTDLVWAGIVEGLAEPEGWQGDYFIPPR